VNHLRKSPDVAARARQWKRLGVAVAMVLIAAAAVVFFQGTPRQSVSPSREVLRNELQFVDGRLTERGVPFTGVVLEYYADGQLKSRSWVSNGLFEGLSEGWYTNGVLQVTEHFHLGLSHGLRTKYFENGSRLSVARIVEARIQGLYERWHQNGVLAEKVFLTNGVANGESLAFHPDGSLKARVRLDSGKVIKQEFWEPGVSTLAASASSR
jgi:antitoxin component YwqK of YwqJK toxin-antitoxin module